MLASMPAKTLTTDTPSLLTLALAAKNKKALTFQLKLKNRTDYDGEIFLLGEA